MRIASFVYASAHTYHTICIKKNMVDKSECTQITKNIFFEKLEQLFLFCYNYRGDAVSKLPLTTRPWWIHIPLRPTCDWSCRKPCNSPWTCWRTWETSPWWTRWAWASGSVRSRRCPPASTGCRTTGKSRNKLRTDRNLEKDAARIFVACVPAFVFHVDRHATPVKFGTANHDDIKRKKKKNNEWSSIDIFTRISFFFFFFF